MKTLGKTTWEKIKINEVFAVHGCWCIYYKINKTCGMLIATDHLGLQGIEGLISDFTYMIHWKFKSYIYDFGYNRNDEMGFDALDKNPLYKLPLSTQRLFRQDV